MSATRQVRNVEHARQVIGDLFGYTPEWLAFALDGLGAAALTDEAVMLIAQAQMDAEWAKAGSQ